MEKVIVAKARELGDGAETTICLTRYGNVMGSRGSVIPLFFKLIKEGKPLTVTDPNMTRYMMTLEDAVDLVMYAFKNGKQGDLFVLTEEYEAKCAQYEADIAALQQENAELQTTVNTLKSTLVAAQVKLDYVYNVVTTPHYDILPDEEP